MSVAAAMDRMYHRQRHIYDFTRKYYLLGRDRLLREIAREAPAGARVLEIGCGTARNLARLTRLRPDLQLRGLDASAEMLATAQARLRRRGLDGRIVLRTALAETWSPAATFDEREGFDLVFFSYSLSMIPAWREALENAQRHLRPGGTLRAVDFWDQGGWPRWFRRLLRGWLDLFHVRHRPELLDHLRALEMRGGGRFSLAPVAGRYAWLGTLAPEPARPASCQSVPFSA